MSTWIDLDAYAAAAGWEAPIAASSGGTNTPTGSVGASIQRFEAPALAKTVRLLRYLSADPALADRAVYLLPKVTVTDSVPVVIDVAQDESQEYSIAVLRFTAASGAGFYDPTGGTPKADGSRGLELEAGGGKFTIRGTWNIRKFTIIAAAGATMTFAGVLYKTPIWSNGILRDGA